MSTPTPPLTDHLADARPTDYFFIREQLSDASSTHSAASAPWSMTRSSP
jgi:hypothetical protein